MEFTEYYKDADIVLKYDSQRNSGLKAKVIRKLELIFVDTLTNFKKQEKLKILEIGVGTGFIARLLVKKGKYYGADISKEMLKIAEKRLNGNYQKLIHEDILNPKIKDKFDRIITIRVISHFNKEKSMIALKNIRKLLNKDGEFVFNIENVSRIRRMLRKILNWGSTYNYQYSKKDINDICKIAGFKIKEIIYLDHFFMLPFHLANKLFFNKLDNLIINLELKLKRVSFMSNNSFIRAS